MFNLGGMEILVILVVALLVLGPDKLPGFMRAAGKALGELRRFSADLRDTVNTSITDDVPPSLTSSSQKETPKPELSAPLPPRKRPLPRARRFRPRSAPLPHSVDDAGDS